MTKAGKRWALGSEKQHRPQFGIARAEPEMARLMGHVAQINHRHFNDMVEQFVLLEPILVRLEVAILRKVDRPAIGERWRSIGVQTGPPIGVE
jgi:hypothetical protein